MQPKFKSILNDEQLQNNDIIQEYLNFSFNRRKAKKDFKLYINICKIYDHDQKVIETILNNIPVLGYYKDYFYILQFSRNDNLNKYIYDLVINQLNQDLENIKLNKSISTLGKWLPRENSKINKITNFVDKFNNLFYPQVPLLTARKKYRKLKSMINDKLGTLEAKLCTKQYDKIDFNKVSHTSLVRNKETILKNNDSKELLDKHEFEELKKMDLNVFIKKIINNTYDHKLLQRVWDTNRFCQDIPYLDQYIGKSKCFIDLSKDSFSIDLHFHAIGMALLVNHFSNIDHKLIVNNRQVQLNNSINIVEQVNKLMNLCGPIRGSDGGPCKMIDLSKIELEDKNTMIVVSNKPLNYHEEKYNAIQLTKSNAENYNLIFYNGDKVRTFIRRDYNYKLDKKKHNRKINDIIKKSDPIFNNNLCFNVFIILFILWIFYKMHWILI